jgi:hypothetical protein
MAQGPQRSQKIILEITSFGFLLFYLHLRNSVLKHRDQRYDGKVSFWQMEYRNRPQNSQQTGNASSRCQFL